MLNDPWQLSPEELLDKFMEICQKVQAPINWWKHHVIAPSVVAERDYFKVVILARLEGKNPPFKAGDKVKPKDEKIRAIFSLRGCCRIPGDEIQVVWRVYYNGKGQWHLSFKDILSGIETEPFFKAKDFCLVSLE